MRGAITDDEIIDVPDVVSRAEIVFDVLVELVEVNIGEELAGPVSQRHSLPVVIRVVMLQDDPDEPQDVIVRDATSDDPEERVVIDGVEIALDVALETVPDHVVIVTGTAVASAGPRDFARELLEAFDRGERSPAAPARVAVVNEARFEDRLEDVDERGMDDAIAEVALADNTRFGIAENELLQRPGTIRFGTQLVAQQRELVLVVLGEPLHRPRCH